MFLHCISYGWDLQYFVLLSISHFQFQLKIMVMHILQMSFGSTELLIMQKTAMANGHMCHMCVCVCVLHLLAKINFACCLRFVCQQIQIGIQQHHHLHHHGVFSGRRFFSFFSCFVPWASDFLQTHTACHTYVCLFVYTTILYIHLVSSAL